METEHNADTERVEWTESFEGFGKRMTTVQRWQYVRRIAKLINASLKRGGRVTLETHIDGRK